MELLFWIVLAILFYTYIGYGILLIALVKIRDLLFSAEKAVINPTFQPAVSLIIPCYNEYKVMQEKIRNCLELDYPSEKLEIIFITDGSNDKSTGYLLQFKEIKLLHQDKRSGKSVAENRAVQYSSGEIIIFSDANTLLPADAIHKMVRHYINPAVGAVSGEKRTLEHDCGTVAGISEGFLWKYESILKRYDARLFTIVGAAGDLFSFRKHLYKPFEEDTISDAYVLSLRITQAGYRVLYDPAAIALETSSASNKKQLNRKINISTGNWQVMQRLISLFNIFRHPVLTFQYISHRVLRWTLAPACFLMAFPLNLYLSSASSFYTILLLIQILFYAFAMAGFVLDKKEIRFRPFAVPYYFMMMNYAAFAGFLNFLKENQPAIRERPLRKTVVNDHPV